MKLARNTVGLRDALFEEWEALRDGSSNPARARSIAMMANTILQSVQVEIEYHKYVADLTKRGSVTKAVDLSQPQDAATTNIPLTDDKDRKAA